MPEQRNRRKHRHGVNVAAAASCYISLNCHRGAADCNRLSSTVRWHSASVHPYPLQHTPSLLPWDCPAYTEAVPAARRQHTPEQEPCTQPLPWKPAFLVKPSGCHLLCFLEGWRETRKWSAGLNPWFALGNNCTWSQGAEVPEVNSISERKQKQSCKIHWGSWRTKSRFSERTGTVKAESFPQVLETQTLCVVHIFKLPEPPLHLPIYTEKL